MAFFATLCTRVPTLLCIDDQSYAIAGRAARLRTHGYAVHVAAMDRAVDVFVNNPVDAVLLDCHMEQVEEIATILREIRPTLPIIAMASYCALPCRYRHLVTACIGKRENPRLMLDELELVLRTQPPDQQAA